ncbi:hypothetical protein DFH27DRAFT_562671 [Peziza echinospora]|nr:hypothetical protein DFH27DRAFT_562671 [Peziza echinospora]
MRPQPINTTSMSTASTAASKTTTTTAAATAAASSIIPKFTTEQKTQAHVITEAELNKYATSLGAVVAPTPGTFPSPVPNVLVSALDPNSTKKYVYVGVHHTLFNTNPIPAPSAPSTPIAPNTPVFIARGPASAATGKEKLNSIFREGIRPALNAHRALLYGPGVYLTQRPAAGNLAAAGGLLGLTPEQLHGKLWDIIQIHVFVPYEEYITWRVQPVKLIPDCDAFHADPAIQQIRKEDGLRNDSRTSWGLNEEDVVVTSPRTSVNQNHLIEELVLSETSLKNAKLLAQVLPQRELFLPYMQYRSVHRYKPRTEEEGEWSELAIRVLENGDESGGVKQIKDSRTYEDLKAHVATFGGLGIKQDEGRYWKALEKFRERK